MPTDRLAMRHVRDFIRLKAAEIEDRGGSRSEHFGHVRSRPRVCCAHATPH